MTQERFECEHHYQVMLVVFRNMRKQGILSESDLAVAEKYLREKYRPIFTTA